MIQGTRKLLKKKFDSIVYRFPFANKVLRNLNKLISPVVSLRIRPYGIMRVRLRNGVSFLMDTNETSSVTKLLFWNGPDNYEYTSIFIRLIKNCDTFLDVGSNTGYYSLLAATCNPKTKVYALEPAAAPLHYLNINVSINKLETSIRVFDLALSEAKGEMEFFEVDNYEKGKENLAGSGSLQPAEIPVGKFKIRAVKTDTLDNFVQMTSISSIHLIKLDTEGTEHLILQNAHQTLSLLRPIIICETLFQIIEPQLEEVMSSYRYSFYNYKNGSLIKTESIVREVDNGIRDCFFVPQEKEDWIKEFVS